MNRPGYASNISTLISQSVGTASYDRYGMCAAPRERIRERQRRREWRNSTITKYYYIYRHKRGGARIVDAPCHVSATPGARRTDVDVNQKA
ncbi:hypothetical protein BUPH_08403 (plasmid) [Paraburkholderia phenoliruptrix BR3459a]|uniref:Uncharacterized protein n=1 Tax=Paraburkholderia phenoliruptrix BR3459a TaxID=1229205 RepID=K0DWA9_9BURK|nr:hypothetical protein BUPH_08403 [Paraburkholderia phenoliruptrix BR3459a]